MSDKLLFLNLNGYTTGGRIRLKLPGISYQLFGQKLGSAPIVLVNHALTGNSDVAGEKNGWWKALIGDKKLIDTRNYTVLAFNIPGNGFDGQELDNYSDFTAKDIAAIFIAALDRLGIKRLHAAIGGSLGGGIAWEMAVLKPDLINYLIPVAADWKSTDWIIGHNYIQERLLENSEKPLQDARMMAMLFYRTPESFKAKFNRSEVDNAFRFNVNSWLQHHGDKLEGRFRLSAYRLMNHLLTTINIVPSTKTFNEVVAPIQSTIVQVAVDSDLFFSARENRKTKEALDKSGIENHYFEIQSPHGHDAFLIEHEQLTTFLTPFFKAIDQLN